MHAQQDVRALKENDLRKYVLIPLLKAMGFQDVFEYHGGAGEQGKDIVCWSPDKLGVRSNLAIVAKATPITGKASVSKGTAAEVRMQIEQCFGKPFLDPVHGEEQHVHQCWVVSNQTISKEAIEALKSSLKANQLERNVSFIDGDRLWELIEKHMPNIPMLQKISEAGKWLDSLDTHYSVEAQTSGSGVHFDIKEKFPGASQEKPITLQAQFEFPDTDEGRAVREAFLEHIAKGTPVEIPASFAKFIFPEFFQALFGEWSQVKTVRLGPIAVPDSMLVRMEILNEDGNSSALEYVDLKLVQGGKEEVTLTNDHQPIPTRIRLVFDLKASRVHFTMNSPLYGLNVKQIWDGLRLQQAMSRGGTLRITHLNTGLQVLEVPFPSGSTESPDVDFLEVMQDLVAIQMKIGRPINMPDRDLSEEEENLLNKLRYIFHVGRLHTQWETLNVVIKAKAARQALPEFADGQAQPINLTDSEQVVLFGVELPLGSTDLHASQGKLSNEENIRVQLEHAADDTPVTMQFVPGDDDSLTITYLAWITSPLKPSEPSELLEPDEDGQSAESTVEPT